MLYARLYVWLSLLAVAGSFAATTSKPPEYFVIPILVLAFIGGMLVCLWRCPYYSKVERIGFAVWNALLLSLTTLFNPYIPIHSELLSYWGGGLVLAWIAIAGGHLLLALDAAVSASERAKQAVP